MLSKVLMATAAAMVLVRDATSKMYSKGFDGSKSPQESTLLQLRIFAGRHQSACLDPRSFSPYCVACDLMQLIKDDDCLFHEVHLFIQSKVGG